MDLLISPIQIAFIKGTSIIDNIILAHEPYETFNNKKKNAMKLALKIDMKQAAYDRVTWNFLIVLLMAVNFTPKWVHWIMYTIVSNTLPDKESPTQTFKPQRGPRQGDPLSPYLFLICTNILPTSILQAENLQKVKDINQERKVKPLLTSFC